jgi:hypothetical protein
MVKVKTQDCETGQINNIVRRNFKKSVCDRIKIFGVSGNPTKLHEKEIEPVKYKKGKNCCSCPDHEPGEK